MTAHTITRKRLLSELGIKYLFILLLFGGLYSPVSIPPIANISPDMQESVISFMGFLMAAAIIGAFELSYSRTNLNDKVQRYLAHGTKVTLYSSIMLLTQIAIIAIQISYAEITWVMVMAAGPIIIALVIYDFWDALRALDELGRR